MTPIADRTGRKIRVHWVGSDAARGGAIGQDRLHFVVQVYVALFDCGFALFLNEFGFPGQLKLATHRLDISLRVKDTKVVIVGVRLFPLFSKQSIRLTHIYYTF